MTRVPDDSRLPVSAVVTCCIVLTCVHAPTALGEGPNATQRLPLSASPAPGVVEQKEYWSRPISWRGHEYPPAEAIPVLAEVVLDTSNESAVRTDALKELLRLANQLGGTEWVARLVARYGTLESVEEKAAALKCLVISEDPRAFPVFYSVLESESEPVLRARAALGLAKWNVQRGVEELITLFPSTDKTSWLDVGVTARRSFTSLNMRKAWGCPEEQIDARAIAAMEADGHDAGVKELMRGFREWFDGNKDRFPEWKPGDRLPEIPDTDRNASDGQ